MRTYTSLALFALLIVTVAAPTITKVTAKDPSKAQPPVEVQTQHSETTPIIVAQGRCFNGRCY